MGDRLRAAKPSWYVTGHQGQLSILSREVGKSSVAGVKAGCVHLHRVAGNTVLSYLASDTP